MTKNESEKHTNLKREKIDQRVRVCMMNERMIEESVVLSNLLRGTEVKCGKSWERSGEIGLKNNSAADVEKVFIAKI